MLVSSVKVTMVLELYRRKWQGVTSIGLRHQSFDNRLKNEPRVRTLIRPILSYKYFFVQLALVSLAGTPAQTHWLAEGYIGSYNGFPKCDLLHKDEMFNCFILALSFLQFGALDLALGLSALFYLSKNMSQVTQIYVMLFFKLAL